MNTVTKIKSARKSKGKSQKPSLVERLKARAIHMQQRAELRMHKLGEQARAAADSDTGRVAIFGTCFVGTVLTLHTAQCMITKRILGS